MAPPPREPGGGAARCAKSEFLSVEVVYALPERQWHRRIRARPGATVLEVIRQSGVLTAFPEIDVAHAKLGIFSRRTNLEQRVRSGDRVEIYRPLKTDPKSARRLRARGEDRA